MDNSSKADEEEPSSLSEGTNKLISQNESKLKELSQMMFDLKEEMFRLQHKNSCKINRVQNMVNGLSDTVKAKEEAVKEAEKQAKPSPIAHHTKNIQPPAQPMAKSTNSQQEEGQGTRSPSQTRSLPPMSPPPPLSMPPLSPPAPPTPRSLPPMSPPPLGSWPPMPPRGFQPLHRSYSHGDPRRMPRLNRPDPANGNILKAALRVVDELDFDELQYLKRQLHCQMSDYE